MEEYCIVSGGFDPLHSGHIALIQEAAEYGPVIVILNTDAWLERKKGKAFLPFVEREVLVKALRNVDHVYTALDDNNTVAESLRQIRKDFPDAKLHFANGGDRHETTTPEDTVCQELNINCIYGIGGRLKKNSSSWVLAEWKAPKTIRPWGYYRVLHEVDGIKVKELTVNPGMSLSMQKHKYRSEYWLVDKGNAVVKKVELFSQREISIPLSKHDSHRICYDAWHQLTNPYNEPCCIIELQFGQKCVEDDIERKLNDK